VADANYRIWLREIIKKHLFTTGGNAGLQIMQKRLIPLSPFAVKPIQFDREISVTGAPLWQLVYSRTPSEEARPLETTDAEHFTSLLDRPLTNTAKDELRKDVALFTKQEDSRIASDNKVHA
jgi:hypothetical protein